MTKPAIIGEPRILKVLYPSSFNPCGLFGPATSPPSDICTAIPSRHPSLGDVCHGHLLERTGAGPTRICTCQLHELWRQERCSFHGLNMVLRPCLNLGWFEPGHRTHKAAACENARKTQSHQRLPSGWPGLSFRARVPTPKHFQLDFP